MVALRMSLYFSSKGSVRPCAAHHIAQAASLLIELFWIAMMHKCCAAGDEDEGAHCQHPSRASAEQAQSPPTPVLT